ncbi:tRNA preQ1(34) S-adenosylmethionine ribosyltransferase-isomerase QueA [Helicobacter sp. 23-1045]
MSDFALKDSANLNDLARLKRLTSYDYALDSSLIASKPTMPKSAAKLLVYDRARDTITHTTFARIWDFIPQNCLIVLNDTKVINARIYGVKSSGAKIELLYHKYLGESNADSRHRFLVQIKGKVRVGDCINFSDGVSAKVRKLRENGLREVEFYRNDEILDECAILAFLEAHGHIPLPPYIKRSDNEADLADYQSIFAKNIGSIAAPTASLHFSDDDMREIKARPHCFVSLHIGAGTFFAVESADITAHKMHCESFFVAQKSAEMIKNAREILCVGTTATRCVEHLAQNQISNKNGDFYGECDIFINPLNPPRKTSHILTNFHLPKSTLIMLVAGFIGLDKTLEIYQIAQNLKYKFYSYGDCMLIL